MIRPQSTTFDAPGIEINFDAIIPPVQDSAILIDNFLSIQCLTSFLVKFSIIKLKYI